MSIRAWNERRLPWHRLLFWACLSMVVFSLAANDLLHAPNCPENLRLQWAGHAASAPTISAPTPVLHLENECAACWFQFDSLAVFAALTLNGMAAEMSLQFARFENGRAVPASHFFVARGPPARMLPQLFA